jgi:membrane-associated phospholipid phosphatase
MTRLHGASTLSRLVSMFSGWGTVGLCYSIGRLSPRPAHLLHESAFDRLIPFDASAIWLYLSFFILVPVAYFCTPASRLRTLTRAMQLCAIFAAVIFVLWPTTLIYPPDPSGFGAEVWRFLARYDSPHNCLPSLHGALTALCVAALWQRERPLRTAFVLIWGCGIAWSVVQARRHLMIDLVAGIALGLICAGIVTRVLSRADVAQPHSLQESRS